MESFLGNLQGIANKVFPWKGGWPLGAGKKVGAFTFPFDTSDLLKCLPRAGITFTIFKIQYTFFNESECKPTQRYCYDTVTQMYRKPSEAVTVSI